MVGAESGGHNADEGVRMVRKRHYSIEFQDQACKLVTDQGYTQQRAADELGVSRIAIQNWMKKRGLVVSAEVVEPHYMASDDPKLLKARILELEKQLRRAELEKQLRRAELEKEILKKATAYFASQNP